MTYYHSSDALYHHGILGQKWGIRRFQNSDGSYTEAGKKRRIEESYSEDYKKYESLKKKSPKEMSNNELKEFNKRAQLEQDYRRLNPNAIAKGLAVAGALSAATITLVNLYNNSSNLIKIGKKIVRK